MEKSKCCESKILTVNLGSEVGDRNKGELQKIPPHILMVDVCSNCGIIVKQETGSILDKKLQEVSKEFEDFSDNVWQVKYREMSVNELLGKQKQFMIEKIKECCEFVVPEKKQQFENNDHEIVGWNECREQILKNIKKQINWCMCTELSAVARNMKSTCSKCGGDDAYGTSSQRPAEYKKRIKT